MFEIGKATHAGRKRNNIPNQDASGEHLPSFLNRRNPLLVLADGMGGHNGGAIASSLVVSSMLKTYRSAPISLSPVEILKRSIHTAHHAVRKMGGKTPELASMGSTVVAAILESEAVHIANIGDSRAYIFRTDEIIRLSLDHSIVGEKERLGLLTQEQARRHPDRNRLTMSVNSQREEVVPYLTTFKWLPEDVLVLCSDGLWGVVPEEVIKAVVLEMPPQQAANKLIDLANASQGPDNISVIIACRKNRTKKETENINQMLSSDETDPGIRINQ